MLCYMDNYSKLSCFCVSQICVRTYFSSDVSVSNTLQITRKGSCCYCIQLEIFMLNFSLNSEIDTLEYLKYYVKQLLGGLCDLGKKWKELNLPLGKVFVRNVYHLFYICFLSLWLLNICTGNRGQRCLPSLKWNQYLFISGKRNTFSCTFVQCGSNFHYRGITCRAKQYCAYPKDVSY